jgi:hypothetical protein
MKEIIACMILSLLGFWITSSSRAAELAELNAKFGAKIKEVEDPFRRGVDELNQKYVAALERQQKAAQDAGQLDNALALRTEKDLVTSGRTVPEEDAKDTPEALKTMRATYRETYASLAKTRLDKSRPIFAAYAQALDALKVTLTKEGKLDDAKLADDIRTTLNLTGYVPAPTPAPTPGAKPANPAQPVEKPLGERIIHSRWSWIHPGTDVTFFAGGKAMVAGQDFYKWKVSETDPWLIEGSWSSNRTFELKIDKNFKTAKAVIDKEREWNARLLDADVTQKK